MFADEFDEFRARSYSGGLLPTEASSFKKVKIEQLIQDTITVEEETVIDEYEDCCAKALIVSDDRGKAAQSDMDTSSNEPTKTMIQNVPHDEYMNEPCRSVAVLPSDDFIKQDHSTLISEVIVKLESLSYKTVPQKTFGLLTVQGDDEREWSLGERRPRVKSMPSERSQRLQEAWPKRLRSFTITSRGIVNRGPVYVSRRSSNSIKYGSECIKELLTKEDVIMKKIVGLVGGAAVGKSTILRCFHDNEATRQSYTSGWFLTYLRKRTNLYDNHKLDM